MIKNESNKILALLIVAVLVISMFPANVFAVNPLSNNKPTEQWQTTDRGTRL